MQRSFSRVQPLPNFRIAGQKPSKDVKSLPCGEIVVEQCLKLLTHCISESKKQRSRDQAMCASAPPRSRINGLLAGLQPQSFGGDPGLGATWGNRCRMVGCNCAGRDRPAEATVKELLLNPTACTSRQGEPMVRFHKPTWSLENDAAFPFRSDGSLDSLIRQEEWGLLSRMSLRPGLSLRLIQSTDLAKLQYLAHRR